MIGWRDMCNSAETADPHTAIRVIRHGKDIVGEESLRRSNHRKTLAIVVNSSKTPAGTGPDSTFRILVEHKNVIAWQTVFGCEVPPFMTVEAR